MITRKTDTGIWQTAALALVVAFAVFAPQGASAQTLWMPVTGKALIGQVSGDAWMGVQPTAGGACRWSKLGVGGLTSDLVLLDTNGPDTITLVSSPMTHCGFTFSGLLTRGYFVDIRGGGGGDSLYSNAISHAYLSGGVGGDYISNEGAGFSFGEDGNDVFWSRGYGRMYGGNGNDIMVQADGSRAEWVDGGPGTDAFCGSTDGKTNVESSVCF